MAEPVTSDTVPAIKDEGTLDELSKRIEFATDRVAVQRNQQLIDSFIQEKWRIHEGRDCRGRAGRATGSDGAMDAHHG